MNDYSAAPAEWRDHLVGLLPASMPTPAAGRMTTGAATDLYRQHDTTVCGCQPGTAPLDCTYFTPARLPGICHTMHVVMPQATAWVVDASDGPGCDYLFGPFDGLPEAIEWVAAVSAAELRQG